MLVQGRFIFYAFVFTRNYNEADIELSYSVAEFATSAQQKRRTMYSQVFSVLMVWFEFM